MDFNKQGNRMKRLSHVVLKTLAYTLGIVLTFSLGYWAALQTKVMNEDAREDIEQVYVEARDGVLSRNYNFAVTVETPMKPIGSNQTTGIITAVGNKTLNNGSVVFKADTQPIFSVQSNTPFWREISYGTSGEDVMALQQMLKATGHLQTEPTGKFDDVTLYAWRQLQKVHSTFTADTVEKGKLIAFPQLPVTVEFTELLRTGQQLNGGEDLIHVPEGNRQYYLNLAKEQLEFAPLGAEVRIIHNSKEFVGTVTEYVSGESAQNTKAMVSHEDGTELCEPDCASLPSVTKQDFLATITPTKAVQGVIIPISAIHTDAENNTYVTDAAGRKTKVTIKGTSQGMAAVEGIAAGTRLQLSLNGGERNESESRKP